MAYKTLNIALEELISSTTITKSNAFNSKDFLEIAICFGDRSLKPAGKKQLSNLRTVSMAQAQEGKNTEKQRNKIKDT